MIPGVGASAMTIGRVPASSRARMLNCRRPLGSGVAGNLGVGRVLERVFSGAAEPSDQQPVHAVGVGEDVIDDCRLVIEQAGAREVRSES